MEFVPQAPSDDIATNAKTLYEYALRAEKEIPRLPFLIRTVVVGAGVKESVFDLVTTNPTHDPKGWFKDNEKALKDLFAQLGKAEAFITPDQLRIAQEWKSWLSNFYKW